MRERKHNHFDLGEAISMEDAISMMTIIFVLFVIFLVPLVSIDKARLEKKTQDHFWEDVVAYLSKKSNGNISAGQSYLEAFNIGEPRIAEVTQINENIRYIEFLAEDSSLIFIRHNLENSKYNSLRLSKFGETTKFQHGSLTRLDRYSEWFSLPDEEVRAYLGDKISDEFIERYRKWRQGEMKGSE